MDDVAFEIVNGPTLAPKRVERNIANGEVKVIKPPDPEKLAALYKHRENIKKRRVKAGFSAMNNTKWGRNR